MSFLARRAYRLSLASTFLFSSLLLFPRSPTLTQPESDSDPAPRHPPPLSTLLRTYTVYTLCSFPTLIDLSPRLLAFFMGVPVPGVRPAVEAVVRATFFKQFVGGESAVDVLPLLHRLRSENKGVLFAYSVEVDESEATSSPASSHHKAESEQEPMHKKIVEEMIRSIDVAADFEDSYHARAGGGGRRTWVAVKMTAMVPDAQSLINFSAHLIHARPPPSLGAPSTEIPFPGTPHPSDLQALYPAPNNKPGSAPGVGPGLTQEDVSSLLTLHADLRRICTRAAERGVRVIIDAEYRWYQPAIDALTLALSREFNALSPSSSVQPLVYGTYQAYLRRTPLHLHHSLQHARESGYALGVKLVRGAYHPHEVAAHPSPSASASASPAFPKPISPTPTTQHTSKSLSISPDPAPPVWSTKAETDAVYDACVRVLVRAVGDDIDIRAASARSSSSSPSPPSSSSSSSLSSSSSSSDDGESEENVKGPGVGVGVGVLFGTHNWASCEVVLGELGRAGLALPQGEGEGVLRIGREVGERVSIGQLFGMSDALTDSLVDRTRSEAPFVIKYVPYGALKDVMPYLSRRAIENKSLLGDGGAVDERRRAGAAVRGRVGGWFGFGW